MTFFEGLPGWWPMLIGLQALFLLVVGIVFLANKKRAQRQLADWAGKHGTDSVTDPQNSRARSTVAATSVDYQRHADHTSRDDDGDSGSSDGGSDGGGGGD